MQHRLERLNNGLAGHRGKRIDVTTEKPPPETDTVQRLHVVIPCFNDAEALFRLLPDLDQVGREHGLVFDLTVVDDGSLVPVECDDEHLRQWPTLGDVTILRLAANAGHQRALAVGLSDLSCRLGRNLGLVVVMDGDGEDRPADIPRLLAVMRQEPCAAVVAQRTKRSEGPVFRLGYAVFKLFYRLLTGKGISFGNYMLLSADAVRTLVHRGELWHSLPGTLLRARISHRLLATERGLRYCGASRMNFVGLILHGLASISVFSDIALVRSLMFAFVLTGLAGLGVITVIIIRLLTPYAIPGWASGMVLALSIIGLQGLLSTMSLVFILLNGQRTTPQIPRIAAESMVIGRQYCTGPRGHGGGPAEDGEA